MFYQFILCCTVTVMLYKLADCMLLGSRFYKKLFFCFTKNYLATGFMWTGHLSLQLNETAFKASERSFPDQSEQSAVGVGLK